MSGDGDLDVAAWWESFVRSGDEREESIHTAYQQLENTGLINRVRVHQYLCAKHGCVLATVIRVGDNTLARTRDYKLAPNTNVAQSVEIARKKNTLDGDHHWPRHTFDVSSLAATGGLMIAMNCRHKLRNVRAEDVMADSRSARPGHPGPPTMI